MSAFLLHSSPGNILATMYLYNYTLYVSNSASSVYVHVHVNADHQMVHFSPCLSLMTTSPWLLTPEIWTGRHNMVFCWKQC